MTNFILTSSLIQDHLNNWSEDLNKITYKSDQFKDVVVNIDRITCIRKERIILDGEEQDIAVIMGDFETVNVSPKSASFDQICDRLNIIFRW